MVLVAAAHPFAPRQASAEVGLMPATRQIRVASRNFADDHSFMIRRMTSVRVLPVAEQYPSSTDTSPLGASKRTSHMPSVTRRESNKKVPRANHRHNHRRHGGMHNDGGGESCGHLLKLWPDRAPVRTKVLPGHSAETGAFYRHAQSRPKLLSCAARLAQIADGRAARESKDGALLFGQRVQEVE